MTTNQTPIQEWLNKEKKEWGDDLWKWVQKIHNEKRAVYPMMTIFIRKLLSHQRTKIMEEIKEKINNRMKTMPRPSIEQWNEGITSGTTYITGADLVLVFEALKGVK